MKSDALLAHLRTRDLGREALLFDTCGSTQTVAIERLLAGAAHGLLVHSENQTEGRGRAGRTWLSGPGSLTFSVILARGIVAASAPHYAFIAGLGVRRAICGAALKWPNDLWLSGRKVGGVLASLETHPLGVVVGVGLNTGFDPAAQDRALQDKAGTLPASPEPAALLARILFGIEFELSRYQALGAEATLAEVRAALALVSEKVQVQTSSGMLEGEVIGIADDFALRLQTPEGEQLVQLGDVWPVER